jgi:cob(I)alamin adenosyltransferase
MTNTKRKGLILVYTGAGKGKTTAALGTAVRALGYGWQVTMIQFIKGTWKYGEMNTIKDFGDRFELHRMGAGFYKIMDDDLPEEVHQQAADKAIDLLIDKLHTADHELVIADELNVAYSNGLVDEVDLKRVIDAKPPHIHLIITGRGAPAFLIDAADLVTEMREVKHPFRSGIKAQPGIDY